MCVCVCVVSFGCAKYEVFKNRIITGFYIRFQVPADSQQCRRILKMFFILRLCFQPKFCNIVFRMIKLHTTSPKKINKTLNLDMPPPLSPQRELFSQSSDVAKKFGKFWLQTRYESFIYLFIYFGQGANLLKPVVEIQRIVLLQPVNSTKLKFG